MKLGDKSFENAFNREFAQFLQKMQPKVYGSDLLRYFEFGEKKEVKEDKSTVVKSTEIVADNEKSTSLNIPSIFGLGPGRTREERPNLPKWKVAKPLVSKESVQEQTSRFLANLTVAESNYSRLLRVENFIDHLKKYPEAKHCAVKEGAIRLLLKMRHQTKNETVLGAINEAFAILGYTDPVPGSGVRILSIDGGGTRGILVVEMLRKLEELTGKPIYEMFDLICGVSTGAIIATLGGLKRHTLDEISEIYKSISTQIFTQSTLKGTSNLVWSQSYYDTALWEKLLREQWGDKELIETARDPKCPKFCAISAVVNQSRLSAYIFRNYDLPFKVQSNYQGGFNHKVWESVRASAAAPTYFEEFKLGNKLHQDGGILVNNPTAVAIHEAKLLWPTTPIQCVISFGTGRTAPNPLELSAPNEIKVNNSSWKHKFLAIIDSATDTENVHTMLSDLLPADVYYRFNPYLTEMLNISEIDPKKLEQLERDALMYLRRNEDKFQEAAKALGVGKKTTQKLVDWVNFQKELHGFNLG